MRLWTTRRLIAWAAIILGLLICQEVILGKASLGPLLSELLQAAAAGLAAMLCFGASRRASNLGRLFWMLLGLAITSAFLTDLTWVWAEGVRHMDPVAISLIRFVPYVRTALLVMVLFVDLEARASHPDFGFLLDSIQVTIVFLFIYVLVDYIPAHFMNVTEGLRRGVLIWLWVRVAMLILAGAQTIRTRGKPMHDLYIGLTLYLCWYLVGEGAAAYAMAVTRVPSGSALDLAWALPNLAVAFWAGRWVPASVSLSAAPARALTIGELMWTNATFSLAPLIVLLQITQLGSEFQLLRYSLLGLSFLCFAGRLGLSEFRRSRDQEELQRHQVAIHSAQEDLYVQGAFLEQLIETAPEAIAIVDSNSIVQRINREFTRLFGYQPGDAVGRAMHTLIIPGDKKDEWTHYIEVVNAGNTVAAETTRRNKDGTPLDVSVLLSPVMLRGERIATFCIYRDISERKRTEEELRQSQKMEAVGRLAGGVAHDFNNLLTVINGYGDLLLRRLREDDPARPQLEQIRRAGEQAALLTQQLLAFGRKQIVQAEPLDLNRLITESKMMFGRLIGEHIELVTHLSPSLGTILADSGQIHQVLMNLMANARDAMPNGGAVTIETADVDLDGQLGSGDPDARAGCYVLLSVSDVGSGMDEETRRHLFEPFYTTKGQGAGTGLGLSTVYGIVQRADGWIGVDSEPGKGSTFRIYFPRLDVGARPGPRLPSSLAELAGSETLLIVEDQEDVRRLAVAVLAAHGYRVLEAATGDEALAVARDYPASIDLILTDVVLPGINGPATAERLQVQRPGLKVLYTSGYTRGALKSDMRYIPKPYTPEGLVEKVREALNGKDP